LATAVQEQPFCVVIEVDPDPPVFAAEALFGDRLLVQVIPGCVTVNVAKPPFTEIVPTRCCTVVFACTL